MATLFGFTATFCDKNNMPLFNVLALRGTVTDEEAFYDAKDWSDTTSCLLPTVGEHSYSIPNGLANASLYAFYADGDLAFSGLGPSYQGSYSCYSGASKSSLVALWPQPGWRNGDFGSA